MPANVGVDNELQRAIAASQATLRQEQMMTGGVAGQAAAFGQMTGQIEDENLQNAIAASMKEKGTHDVNYEPIARVD